MLDHYNYGINLTPHLEKYQNPLDDEQCDVMHATWSFGNILKSHDYLVCYMHGPIGRYEGLPLIAEKFLFTKKDQTKEWNDLFPKDRVYFLWAKLDNELYYDSISSENIKKARFRRAQEVVEEKIQVNDETNKSKVKKKSSKASD